MVSASESTSLSPRVVPPGWTIRGKWFVAPFVMVLVLLLAWTLAIAIQFQTIMIRLDRARSDWPAASQDLAKRFDALQDRLQGASAPEISDADRKAWDQAYTAFQQTTQYDRQLDHAAALEKLCQRANGQANPLPDTPSISRLIACERERLQAQQSIVGRLAIAALRLKLPGTFSGSY